MSQTLDPVFGQWFTEKQIGSGTDGKVFEISKFNFDATKETSVMKILRIGENRYERKSINPDEAEPENEEEYYNKIITQITNNIEAVKRADGGKHFVKYEDWEKRPASDGKGYVVLIRMEQMKSLSNLLDDFSFTLEETIRLGISLCKSLIKCRSFGYIYPNLKPENVLFDKDGICKLGDFGTFSCLEPSKAAIAYKRTQYFMAPEFIKTGNINCSADTYSLGMILFLLTNRNKLPFSDYNGEPSSLSSLNNATSMRISGTAFPDARLASAELNAIIKKACAFKENERYLSPKQMLADLQNALSNKPADKVEYEDIYSKSTADEEPEDEIYIPVVDDVEEEKEPEKIIESVSLKEEIQIPDIQAASSLYENKKTTAQKKRNNFIRLPENKKKLKKQEEDVAALKKIIVFGFIALCMLALIIVSAVLIHSSSTAGDTATVSVAAVIDFISDKFMLGGSDLWLLK